MRRWFSSLHETIWRRNLMRSGMLTGLVLAALLAGLAATYRQHMQGNFHKLKAKIATEREDAPEPRPGGQEAIVLMRTRVIGDPSPEFLTATVLPGRGMNVLQLTAYIPGRGEVNLMASPGLDIAASAMTGKGEDADGRMSLAMGGAFEVPWASRIWGASGQAGGVVNAMWRGRAIAVPPVGGGAAALGGLMLAQAADSSNSEALPDGGTAQGVFHAADYSGRWPSKTDVAVTVLLSARTLELTVRATNVGDNPEPIGIGWHPRFAILDGNRGQLRLHIPGTMHADVHDRGGQPTGALLPVAGTHYDFTGHSGVALSTMVLDDCFTELQQKALDNGPSAELSDPAHGYGLRMTAMSPTIRAMCVTAPEAGDFVSIDPQFNYPDPLGREWEKQSDTGFVVLQPGQSTQWKVRLELYSLSDDKAPM